MKTLLIWNDTAVWVIHVSEEDAENVCDAVRAAAHDDLGDPRWAIADGRLEVVKADRPEERGR